MKKILSTVVLSIFCLFSFFTVNTNASTVDNDSLNSLFPGFQEDLAKYSNGELVTSEEVYVKFKLKDEYKTYTGDKTEEHFVAEAFSKEEYEIERNTEISNALKSGISTQSIGIVDTSQEPSWLRIDFQVYQGNTANKFRCYSFASWKTRPVFTFTDGHGISTSDTMFINDEPIETQYMYVISGVDMPHYERPSYIENRYGVVAKIDLFGGNESIKVISHNSMVAATAQFSNETPGVKQSGKVYSEYLHKQIALGGIGIDAAGTPSVGIDIVSDSYSVSCQVSNY